MDGNGMKWARGEEKNVNCEKNLTETKKKRIITRKQ